MRCPAISELPPPPSGKTGWPWTVETPSLPPVRFDGTPWPRISIITPSYNQSEFIEETIRSVLLQGYPDLEYVIIDGGSTDESVDVIRRYEKWICYWVSEKDRGQPHAINKGIQRTTGELFNWINSDDLLLSGALGAIGSAQTAQAITGAVLNFGADRSDVIENRDLSAEGLLTGKSFHQPGLWVRRENFASLGGVDEGLHFAFDFDFALRYLATYPDVTYLKTMLAAFRFHARSKTCTDQESFHKERMIVYQKLLGNPAFWSIAHLCSRRLRAHLWGEKLEAIMTSNESGLSRAFQVAFAIFKDPSIRASRLSLGAVKRLLLS